MSEIENCLSYLNTKVWGFPLLFLLIGTGIYLNLILKGLPFIKLPRAIYLVFKKYDEKDGEGEISHFQALMTALAATIGVGTIAGVGTAISIGGLGSVFWMAVVGLISMATKYSESILACEYREIDAEGHISGGPMYYISHGLKKVGLAKLFAICGCITALGTGNLVQSQSVADACNNMFNINPWIIGIILSLVMGSVLLGGI